MQRQSSASALLSCLFLAVIFSVQAQPVPTPAEQRLKGFDTRNSLRSSSLLSEVEASSIGPSVFSCRVTDLDVNPADPTEMYVAYASGGLWHSKNNGIRFEPLFDHEASMTIGDIAVNWQNNIIWVGTGEANSSRSSYAGTGVYRSQDGGKTWEHRGLPESHHIARIVLHPTDPNTLWVAVLGKLYSPSQERGVYKTSDGGKTWQRTLFVNENSGAIDLVADPNDPNTLYAATWERTRRAWHFEGAGLGSGIWKSTDGGNTWTASAQKGFPVGPKAGRIGLAAGKKNGKTVLYAFIDNQNPKKAKEDKKEEGLTKDQLRNMSKEDFLKLQDDKIENYLKDNRFPETYSAKKVRELVSKDKIKPVALVEYLEDANQQLFETDYTGAELYRSEDGGASWKKTHEDPLEQMFFTYGYYFANVRCMNEDADQVYLIGFFIVRSEDGGKTWKNINGDNVHVDHHALWLNPARPGHIVNGNDGGVNISWDNGTSWMKCNNPPVGQFYAVTTDRAEPFRVYGGAQDNGVWTGPSGYRASDEWHQTGAYPYEELIGGDGMQIQVDFRDNNTLYTGYQFGNYYRMDRKAEEAKRITPQHELGERPLRFNWQTPIHLSRHQQDVLYLGANKVYRSFDKGDKWEAISGDLTKGGKPGNVPFGTLTSVHESPLRFGLLYAASDDGLIHVTRDGGETWTRISDNLPQDLWVSRVQASAHERGRVYASLNGYRNDDFSAYLYASDDYGQTWKKTGNTLPAEPINVVREDDENENVLYVGTDHDIYVSLDRGETFNTLSAGFPDVAVHDLDVHPSGTLVIGTHGRSMYTADIRQIRLLTPEVLASGLHIFEVPKRKYNRNWGKKPAYDTAKDPELPVWIYSNTTGNVNWTIKMKENDLVLNEGTKKIVKGISCLKYDLSVVNGAQKDYREKLQASQKDPKKTMELEKADTGKIYLRKGSYRIVAEKDGVRVEKDFFID